MDNKSRNTMETRHEARQERQLALSRDPANLLYSSSHDMAREEMRSIKEALAIGMSEFELNLAKARSTGLVFDSSPVK